MDNWNLKANSGIYFVLSFITKEIDNWNINLESTKLKGKYFYYCENFEDLFLN